MPPAGAKKYYVWSPIVTERDAQGVPREYAELGDEVTEGSFGDDVDFQQLIDSGAIRPYAFPDVPDTWQGSPMEYLRFKRNQDEGMSEEEALLAGVTTSGVTTGGSMLAEEELLLEATPETKNVREEQRKAAEAKE